MSTINTNIYGPEEQWTYFDTNTTSQLHEIRGAYFTTGNFNQNNLKAGVTAGALSIGSPNIDNTISTWGINKDCGLCNVSLEAVYNPKEEGEIQEFNIQYEDVPLTTAPAIAKSLFPTSANGIQTNAVTIFPTQSWQLYGQNYTNVPITSFNYTHTVMMCYLEVCSAANGIEVTQNPGVEYIALGKYYETNNEGEYVNNINPTTYPVILGGFVTSHYGYPYKVGTSTTYQTRRKLTASQFSFALFDTYKDFSYLSTPSAITKWDKEKTYPKAISIARDYGGIGECTCVFGQTIQLWNKKSLKTTATEAIQQILSTGTSYQFNAKIKDKGEFFYYTIANSDNMFFGVDYGGLTKEEIYSQFAMLGFWFADIIEAANYAFCGEEIFLHTDVPDNYYQHLYIPLFDENTITTGEYYKARDARSKDLPNYKWGDPHIDNKYNPEYKPGGDTGEYEKKEKDKGNLTTIYNKNNSAEGQSIYVMEGSDIEIVKNFLNANSIEGETLEERQNWLTKNWLGQDPGDFILCCNRFPMRAINTLYDKKTVYIGTLAVRYTIPDDPDFFTLQAYQSDETTVNHSFGSLPIQPYYNDFRDYEPYSHYEIQIPYLGSYHLDPKIWMNHQCGVDLTFDVITCTAIAMINRDGLWYDTVYGNFGTPIPFVTYNSGTFQNAVTNAQANAALSKINVVESALGIPKSITNAAQGLVNKQPMQASALTTNLAKTGFDIAGSVINAQLAEYNLEHMSPKPTNNGGIGGVTTEYSYAYCKLLISRPQPLKYNNREYGKTVGFACCETGKLVNYSGYTVCSNSRIENFEGTQTELLQIQNLLNSGIVLP